MSAGGDRLLMFMLAGGNRLQFLKLGIIWGQMPSQQELVLHLGVYRPSPERFFFSSGNVQLSPRQQCVRASIRREHDAYWLESFAQNQSNPMSGSLDQKFAVN